MLKHEREREIINILKVKGGFASVNELCKELYASQSSIRRDLTELENKGVIKRSYGGAELITSFSNVVAFSKRSNYNIDAKKEIAEKASSLIKDGDIVFLDQSSTSFHLANEITDKSSITVITNNIEIMSLLSATNINVISSGGVLSNRNRNCLIGTDASYIFEKTFADIMFFSSKSLSNDGIISDCTREEVTLRNAMLKNASKKVFLCDSEKIGTKSAYIQCSLDKVDYFVCEKSTGNLFSEFENLTIL